MRTFIRQVYEGQNAPHIEDGHLAFVLLVGDYDEENGVYHYALYINGARTDTKKLVLTY